MAAQRKSTTPAPSPDGRAPDPRTAAYGRAVKRLHEAHAAQLEAFLAEEYAREGLTYKRRLTAEERTERDRQVALAKGREQAAKLAERYGAEVLVLPGQTTVDEQIEETAT